MPHMPRSLIIAAALFAALGIATGAFGAHALKGLLSSDQQRWFDTAVDYHQLAALGTLLMAIVANKTPSCDTINGWLLLSGAALFSATLYAMALGAPRWFGAITPVGGALMIMAWLRLAWQVHRSKET